MATAIALIIAGSGETSEGEVYDLLEDAYPEDAWDEVGLVVPIDKDLYSGTVKNALAWFNDDDNVYGVRTKGASLARGTSKFEDAAQEVEKFADALNKDDFKEWDEVHVLLALPADSEDPDYEFYAEIADLALGAGFVVKDLTAGLDDIVVLDAESAEEAEPEPEPEEEKPARRSRRATKDEESEADEEAPKPSRRAQKAETVEEVQEAVAAEQPAEVADTPDSPNARIASLENRVEELEDIISRLGVVLSGPAPSADPVVEAIDEIGTEKAADEPKRGRGRPRTDFDIRQIHDEDADEWIPRPKGRLKKGTQWRTIHADTNEVLEEGTA